MGIQLQDLRRRFLDPWRRYLLKHAGDTAAIEQDTDMLHQQVIREISR